MSTTAQLIGEVSMKGVSQAVEDLKQVGTSADDAQKNLRTVKPASEDASQSLAGRFGGAIQSGISNLLDFGSQLGQTIFGLQSLAQGAASLAQNLLGPAAAAEQVQGSLEIFTGSAAKAKDELAALSNFAAQTPFETSAIDQAALKLQSVGINATDVIPDIKALGDGLDAAGRTSSADLGQISDAFIKIQTQGHLTTNVMDSFSASGIDAWSVLEKQTGKTHDELANLISSGLYGAKDAMHDLTVGIEANPLYKGQMANDANVFNGAMSTLKSTWDQALASFGSPVIKGLEPVLQGITTQLSSQAFKDFAGNIGQKVVDIFGKIGQFVHDDAKPAIQDFVGVLQSPEFKNFADKLAEIGDKIKNTVQPAFSNLKPKIDEVFNFVKDTALPALTNLASDLESATSAVKNNGTAVGVTGGILTAIFLPAIIKSGVEALTASVKIGIDYLTSIVKTGVEGWTSAGKLAAWIGNAIRTGVEATIAGGKIAAEFVGSIVKSGVEAVTNGAKIAASFVASIVKSGAEAVIAGAKVVASFVASLVQTGIQAGITGGVMVATLIPAIVSTAAEAVITAATAIPALVVGFGAWAISAGVAAIATLALDWPIVLIVLGIAGLIAIIILLATHWTQVTGWIGDRMSDLGSKVHEILDGIGQKFNIVKEIISVMVAQAGDAFHQLGNKVSDIWNGIWGSIKSALNWVIGGIDDFLRGLNSIHVTLPNGDNLGFNIPLIPYLADGGTIAKAGMAIVGERGPERVYLPAGAQVVPNSQSGFGGGSGQPQIVVQPAPVYIDGRVLANALQPYLIDGIRYGTGNWGI